MRIGERRPLQQDGSDAGRGKRGEHGDELVFAQHVESGFHRGPAGKRRAHVRRPVPQCERAPCHMVNESNDAMCAACVKEAPLERISRERGP
jgi:hypothetical protein